MSIQEASMRDDDETAQNLRWGRYFLIGLIGVELAIQFVEALIEGFVISRLPIDLKVSLYE